MRKNFETIVNENYLLIYSLANKYIQSFSPLYDVDDLYQEAVMKLFDVYELYDEKHSITTFITHVVQNLYNNMKRSENAQKRANTANDGTVIDDIRGYDVELIPNHENRYTDYETYVISIALDTLEDCKQREIIEDVLYGETYRAIAEKNGISHQRVHQIFRDFIENVKGGVV